MYITGLCIHIYVLTEVVKMRQFIGCVLACGTEHLLHKLKYITRAYASIPLSLWIRCTFAIDTWQADYMLIHLPLERTADCRTESAL